MVGVLVFVGFRRFQGIAILIRFFIGFRRKVLVWVKRAQESRLYYSDKISGLGCGAQEWAYWVWESVLALQFAEYVQLRKNRKTD